MRPTVSIVRCDSYAPSLVQERVAMAVSLAGGIGKSIMPGSRVLVKPNLLMASTPDKGVVTHPEVVRAVVRILKAHGCTVLVGDGPSAWGDHCGNTAGVYEMSGMTAMCREEGVELVMFGKNRWRGKFPLAAILDSVDHLVTVAKFKTHGITTLTAAVKNLYGLLSSTYKTEMHKQHFRKEDFARIIIEILKEARPSFAVVDGITAMEGEGPGTSGTLRQANVIVASQDAVAADCVLAAIMGVDPMMVPTNKEAHAQGMGPATISDIDITGEPLEKAVAKPPFKLPGAATGHRKVPQPVIDFLKQFITFRPKIDHAVCVRCGVCAKACPKKIISLQHGKMAIRMRECISCFCCQESCPHAAITIRKSLLAKMIGL